jgi:ribonucleoside-diphosphate reductase alpha chain
MNKTGQDTVFAGWESIVINSDMTPAISDNAQIVLEKRYFPKDEAGKPLEDAAGMFKRIARYIAAVDADYGATEAMISKTATQFYELMAGQIFIPNSPTLMNAGRPLGQLSACFVLPVEDSIDRIFDSVKHMALIHKSGGGTGFSFSRLRPKNDMVQSTAGVSSGPVSFISIFNAATETIKQGGTRRGANMAILNVDHPDILEFIRAKENTTALTNFNFSVALTDDFMNAVQKNENYNLINPHDGKITGSLNARQVFDLIIEMAWSTGEPGVVFIDRINAANTLKKVGLVESTNPCGEQPLLPYESCNLGSINLDRLMIRDDGGCPVPDYNRLADVVHAAVHFLDNVIDANRYPLDEIARNTRANRKIGLGVMGFADMLARMNIAYNSDLAVKTAERVMSFIQEQADKASEALAAERGVFPNWELSDYAAQNKKLRNATRTTIAPTGTISMIAGASSGVEPFFALAYARNVMDGHRFIEINPVFKTVLEQRGLLNDDLLEKVAEHGSLHGIEGVPADLAEVFVTAHEIAPEWHVRIQAAFQKYTDNAVSKTVNFAHEASREDIARVFTMAYDTGCKGVTVYRDGSRSGQVLEIQRKESPKDELTVAPQQMIVGEDGYLEPKPRNDVTWGATRKMITGCGSLYVTMNEDENGLFEVFAVMGKSGGCAASQTEAISRLISLGLRCGVDPHHIIKQIKGVRCPNQAWEKGGRIYSCADAIAKALERYLGYDRNVMLAADGERSNRAKNNAETDGKGSDAAMVGVCPECHAPLEFESGCSVCRSCGFSRCG